MIYCNSGIIPGPTDYNPTEISKIHAPLNGTFYKAQKVLDRSESFDVGPGMYNIKTGYIMNNSPNYTVQKSERFTDISNKGENLGPGKYLN